MSVPSFSWLNCAGISAMRQKTEDFAFCHKSRKFERAELGFRVQFVSAGSVGRFDLHAGRTVVCDYVLTVCR